MQNLDLKDIHLPQAISDAPIALGWWFLYVAAVTFVVLAITQSYRYVKRNKAKKIAIANLANCRTEHQMLATLKWAILQYLPRSEAAHIHGEALADYMVSLLPEKHHLTFKQEHREVFNQLYQQHLDTQALASASKFWLTHALPSAVKRAEELR
ncbi:DUF4381 domain-containing protein [Thalassotalea agarivorans]|uniref:DUF4381 domain-containing protein n=1 Tax=Thalassotalea agarivorans TaxID=349064 RepID=A0A1I0BN76_THASX|nr:DUF4381 domain-containing protein [Thalassotalea agarivorans]SET08401.1 protein of unknown function [Thalassotalea agarivorans]